MTTTIKSIEPKTYQGKVTGYSITLENGVVGYLDDKASSSDLKAGESVDYSSVVKQNKKGGNYNLLTLNRVFPGQSQAPAQSAPTPTPSPADVKFITPPSAKVDVMKWKFDSRMQLCELTHKLILEGTLSDSEAKLHLVAWCTEMDNLIDGIFA